MLQSGIYIRWSCLGTEYSSILSTSWYLKNQSKKEGKSSLKTTGRRKYGHAILGISSQQFTYSFQRQSLALWDYLKPMSVYSRSSTTGSIPRLFERRTAQKLNDQITIAWWNWGFADMARIPSLQNQTHKTLDEISDIKLEFTIGVGDPPLGAHGRNSLIRRCIADQLVWTSDLNWFTEEQKLFNSDICFETLAALRAVI